MARRRMKRKTARRAPKRTNLLNVAQSVIIGNAVTEGLFNTNMYEFATGRINGAYTPGALTQSNQITLPELLGAGMGVRGQISTQFGGQTYTSGGTQVGYGGVAAPNTFTSVVQANLQANGVKMLTTLIAAPIVFKVVGKLAAKPRREFNKVAKMVGLPVSM